MGIPPSSYLCRLPPLPLFGPAFSVLFPSTLNPLSRRKKTPSPHLTGFIKMKVPGSLALIQVLSQTQPSPAPTSCKTADPFTTLHCVLPGNVCHRPFFSSPDSSRQRLKAMSVLVLLGLNLSPGGAAIFFYGLLHSCIWSPPPMHSPVYTFRYEVQGLSLTIFKLFLSFPRSWGIFLATPLILLG